MLPATSVLEKLKVHPVLQDLTLDGLTTLTCLASHLKRDILQPPNALDFSRTIILDNEILNSENYLEIDSRTRQMRGETKH